MTGRNPFSLLFVVAAIYEGLIGLVFLVAPGPLFHWAGVPPPNHFGYVRFPAALLVVFGAMFLTIAKDPARNRGMIPYGIALKASYVALVFYYWIVGGVPNLWKPFAFADLAFLFLFGWAYSALGAKTHIE